MRKKTDSLFYSAIILATVVVMAFYGVYSRRSPENGAGAAAYVNGDPITRREFQQELEMRMNQYQAMLGGQYDEKLLAALQIPQRTLDQLIQFKLLQQQAQTLGIVVPDEELADHIRSMPYFQRNGKFDPQLYAQVPNRGVEEKQQRDRLQLIKFQSYLMDRVHVTPAALKWNYLLDDTKVNLDYAKIDFRALATQFPPSPKQIDDYLKQAPPAELQAYYDAHRKDFTEPAQVELRQIRVGLPFQATEAQKAEAKKKIDGIAAKVTPENFADVARAQSDDDTKKKGGLVGWVKRGTLEAPVEAAIDALEVGKVSSAPVETPFGYFLLKVEGKKPEVVQPIADVKHEIATKILSEKQREQFAENKRKEWNAKLAAGESIEPELKKLKIDVKKTGPFAVSGGYIPAIGQAEAILDAVFTLSPDHPLPKQLFEQGNAYYYVKLDSVEPAKDGDFAKNKATVERSVDTAQQTELLTRWVTSLQKKATIEKELKFDNQQDMERSR